MVPSILNVAMLQLVPPGDTNASLRTGLEACRRAKSLGADLAVFPEMWNIGYRFPSEVISVDEWKSWAVEESGPFVRSFGQFAAENDIAVALTFLRAGADGRYYNSVALIDRHGDTVLTYDKVHTCDFSRECNLTPGGGFAVGDLDTRDGPSRDMQIAAAGTEPTVTIASFDLDALRDYRKREVWADAYRRPAVHESLVKDSLAAPFVRADARRVQ